MTQFSKDVFVSAFANDNDALVPEVWAQESLMQLESALVMANLVYRDFEDSIQQEGDIVNCHRPGTFTATRKVDGDALSTSDATVTNVPVPLDQHVYVSFLLYDVEVSRAFTSLIETHLKPAIYAMASQIDRILLCQLYNHLVDAGSTNNCAGYLNTALTLSALTELGEIMEVNNVPMEDRILVITPGAKADLLNIDTVIEADKRGDKGTALRNASIGRLLGFDILSTSLCPAIAVGNTTRTNAINYATGYAAGTTTFVVDGSGAPVAGEWCTIAGDMTPQFITFFSGTALTVSPGIKRAVANDAVITTYDAGAINLSGSSYAAAWNKDIIVDGFSVAPRAGQLVSIGTSATSDRYGIIPSKGGSPATTLMMLNRSLGAAAADDALVGIGPYGDYNFAFNPQALALVNRPLARVIEGAGARSWVANYNNLALRVTIAYDSTYQAHRVTLDTLLGVKTLNADLGAVLLS